VGARTHRISMDRRHHDAAEGGGVDSSPGQVMSRRKFPTAHLSSSRFPQTRHRLLSDSRRPLDLLGGRNEGEGDEMTL